MFTIRKATKKDAKGIAKVHVDSWKSTYKGIVVQAYLDSLTYKQKEEQWSQANFDRLYVAEAIEEHIVGFVSFGKERSENYHFKSELYAIYILEEYQGKGIGKQLVLAAIDELQQQQLSNLLVWVLEENPSRAFYERYSPEKVGEETFSIHNREHVEIAYGWTNLTKLKERITGGQRT
ncbi:GNAT family N-acetyltransferase [Metabacillus herbersteinensis]|uniref:GNAT family N-acetyltransferase n=1 Tax=Metabacillus herbersteinensis TaxID=283816 RepID=A0ABV6GBV5_9BACI